MGIQDEGRALSWTQTQAYSDIVRRKGIQQLIRMFRDGRQRSSDPFLFGDEVEYLLIRLDHSSSRAQVSLRASQLLEQLAEREKEEEAAVSGGDGGCVNSVCWKTEAASFMMEGTPAAPLLLHDNGHRLDCSFTLIESNMRHRRKLAAGLLRHDERLLSLAAFPMLGCADTTDPPTVADPDCLQPDSVTGSVLLSDQLISPHVRYVTMVRHILARRQRKTCIQAPVCQDVVVKTASIKIQDGFGFQRTSDCPPDHVIMDSCVFGHACCSLQVTMQAPDLQQAMWLYDQLAPLCPLLLALTAAAPVHHGYLTQWDSRWPVIVQSTDERTLMEEKRGSLPRFGAVNSYLSHSSQHLNDVPLAISESLMQLMRQSGVPDGLARHFAHVFTRDPLVLLQEQLMQQDEQHADLFLNIQSSVWQTLRFKPPDVSSGKDGWRIEVRPMEAQVTDFENAAFVSLVVLMAQVILSSDVELDMRIAMSKVHENMERAVAVDAVNKSFFWFRSSQQEEPMLMSMDEIMNGKTDSSGDRGRSWPGLISCMQSHMNKRWMEAHERRKMLANLDLVRGRASGQYPTPGKWIRSFVQHHPEYQHDSRITPAINYDMIRMLAEITRHPYCIPGVYPDPHLLFS